MKVCPRCGKKAYSEEKVCGICGYRDGDPMLRRNRRKNKPNKKWGVFFGILLGAVFIIVIIWAFFMISDFYYDYMDELEFEEQEDQEEQIIYEPSESDLEDLENSKEFSFNKYNESDEFIDQIVFLLSFDNQPLNTTEKDWYENFYGDGTYGYGSVNDYFLDSSKGKFSFNPVIEEYNDQDGIIVVKFDDDHPNFNRIYDYEDLDEDAFEIFEQVLEFGDEFIDYDAYDKDGDGNVRSGELSIVLIFAGYEDNELDIDGQENVTSSMALTFSADAQFDDMNLFECILMPEFEQVENDFRMIMPMGTICHELGHTLGLPDLYDIDYSTEGLAFHSLMASGNENSDGKIIGAIPCPMIAWSREYLGFIEPEVVEIGAEYTLKARSRDDYNVVKIIEDDYCYLIENVDFGGYGMGLSQEMISSGVAIWRIDENVTKDEDIMYENVINSDEDQIGVKLMEAYGADDLFGDDSDEFEKHGRYEHYFSNAGDEFETKGGTIIKLLDDAGDVINISIN